MVSSRVLNIVTIAKPMAVCNRTRVLVSLLDLTPDFRLRESETPEKNKMLFPNRSTQTKYNTGSESYKIQDIIEILFLIQPT